MLMSSQTGGSQSSLQEGAITTPTPVPNSLNDPKHNRSIIVAAPSPDLNAAHVGNYYPFDAALLPEAFRPFHQSFYPPRPGHLQRRGGCRGLQAEFEATGGPHLMWRGATQQLATLLDPTPTTTTKTTSGARVLVRGPGGSGKSVALAALAERARARGEVVVYVPDAAALVSGGFFYKRPEDGTFDTIISAQHILKSVVDAHRGQLAALPAAGGGGTLLEVAEKGLATDDDVSRGAAVGGRFPVCFVQHESRLTCDPLQTIPITSPLSTAQARLAVESCLQLVAGLAAAADAGAPVLFAIDNYSALFGPTDYGVSVVGAAAGRKGPANAGGAYVQRRVVAVEELNLVSSWGGFLVWLWWVASARKSVCVPSAVPRRTHLFHQSNHPPPARPPPSGC
jgi:hypothetical protein